MNEVLVATFESHYNTVKAKKTFTSYSFVISPTPRFISSSCSSCLVLSDKMKGEDVEELKKTDGLEGIYIVKGNKKETIYER